MAEQVVNQVAEITLEDAVRSLAELRRVLASTDAELATLRTELAESPLGRSVAYGEKCRKALAEEVGQLDQCVRAKALEAYQTTGSKTPARGVQIKVNHGLLYETAAMVEWAKTNAPKLVYEALDVEKVTEGAKTFAGMGAPITFTEKPTATISKDLSAWLTEAQS